MTGMEQEPPKEASEPGHIIDIRGVGSDDDRLRNINLNSEDTPIEYETTDEAQLDLQAEQIFITSTVLALGLLARESRVAYAIRHDIPWTYSPESQRTLLNLMQLIRDAGHEANISNEIDSEEGSPYLSIYNALYDHSSQENHEQFIDRVDAFLGKQNKFVENTNQIVFNDYVYVLRPFTNFLRYASEAYFIQHYTKPYLEGEILIPDTLIDHGLLKEFTNSAYWEGIPNEFLLDLTRLEQTETVVKLGVLAIHNQLLSAQDDFDDMYS